MSDSGDSQQQQVLDLDLVSPSSSVLVLLHHLPGQCDGAQVGVRWRLLLLLLLLQAASLSLRLDHRVNHGHVHVEVVSFLESLPAHEAGELQLGLRLVFGHVVLQRRSLATLEAANLTLQGLGS